MRLNSNVSSQSNRFTVGLLQAKLLPCYDSVKPEFKAGKRFKHCGNIKFLTSFSLEMFQYIARHFKCDILYSTSPKVNHSVAPNVDSTWVKVPRNENPEIGRGSWGPRRPPCGSRAKPWWGNRGRSPRKLLDFSNLKPHKTALKLWKFKTKQTKILLI